jgi:uncharacterized protein (DUF885 family)
MKLFSVIFVSGILLMMLSCSMQNDDQKFENLAGNYIEKTLQMNPEFATYLGDHRFDNLWNDYTLEGMQNNRQLDRTYLDSLNALNPEKLRETNRIDYQILKHQIKYDIFSIDTLREYEWNPRVYNFGGGIYSLIARDFAPLKERLQNVKERLKGIGAIIAAAKTNLRNPPRIHTETAILQNKGNISLITTELDQLLDEAPELKDEFKPIQEEAVAATEAYGKWLEEELLPRSNGDFRIGDEKYRKKLYYALDSDITKEEILQSAEKDLTETQTALFETALPLFRKYFPNIDDFQDNKEVIKAVLDSLAEDHPTNATIIDLAKKDIETTTQFVEEKNIVTIPDEEIRIIVMPEFQRGVAVAYCDAPGPLENKKETFYAISPTPADWTPGRVNSFFREYNNYMLQDLTIHEAMPGHYLQLAHSNQFKAPTMIRAIYWSGPFVEGWATYAEQVMVEMGYGGPEVKMQQLKMRLRLLINAIIDQKIHTEGMTEQEAMDMMMNEGFQEEGEAAGKWRRACLTSTQLSTYYVGNMEINDIRNKYEAKMGGEIDLKKMHDQMLSYGSPAAKNVKKLMDL